MITSSGIGCLISYQRTSYIRNFLSQYKAYHRAVDNARWFTNRRQSGWRSQCYETQTNKCLSALALNSICCHELLLTHVGTLSGGRYGVRIVNVHVGHECAAWPALTAVCFGIVAMQRSLVKL